MKTKAAVHEETQLALGAVEDNAEEAWLEEARAVLRHVCESRAEFISDDLWAAGLSEPRELRALGAVLRRGQRDGLCERTDRLRPSLHSHLSGKPVWRSLLYRKERA